ncbi:hypothetical protein QIT29_gp06 [Metallosphaera rod-shaped virus 1]|uniref:Uncharacterized protein n=1 Tax=Metallosphaera rod-shaped virus 1 TaxID=2730618 RepID=A0A6M3VYP1_9VIRU|nr:hypothetical protein QIT29_gp06 [Metallosphaera rod-shaped virus 1]QJF12352.1 hypothetical protein MRV1_gp06 [Metallosphaera rod-shaped virus 1]
MSAIEEDPELNAIADAIENQFYRHHTSRIDVILLPISDSMGIFYVTYTIEYVDITNIASVGLEKGIYYYNKETKTLKIQIGRFEKQINLS